MADQLTFFATCALALEEPLAAELRQLGAANVTVERAGVSFAGSLEVAYRACLWLRTANRVLLPVARVPAPTPDALYAGVRTVCWEDHIAPGRTIAVDCAASRSPIGHTHFAALKTKDAIVDALRDRSGSRPSVSVVRPDVRVNVYLQGATAVISIDLSGESLHRRSYRTTAGAAPLKETTAAGALFLADWPRHAQAGVPLLDPMCGSGTIPIEAGLVAANVAPGRGRSYFGLIGWRGHDGALWHRVLAEAEAAELRDRRRLPVVRGYDADARVVAVAVANVERAGLRGRVHIEKRSLAACEPPPGVGDRDPCGLVVTNPPYGERLGARADLEALYATLGDVLRRRFPGWVAYVLTGNPALGKRVGLRTVRRHVLYNGPIECRLLVFPISSVPVRDVQRPRWRTSAPGGEG